MPRQTTGKQSRDIKLAHKNALDQGLITEATAALVWWLYSKTQVNGWSNATVGKKLGLHAVTIARVFDLSYNSGQISDKIVAKISNFRRTEAVDEEQRKYGDAGFIETRMSAAIFEMCDAARISQTMAFVWGESQTGKSAALKRYTELNAHLTIYLSVVVEMTHSGFVRALSEACGGTTTGNCWAVRKSLIKNLTANMLLVIDEVHEPFSTGKLSTGTQIIECLRGIHDQVGCGIVLCGTNVLQDEISRGQMSKVLRQASKRGIIKVQCPDVMPLADVWKFAASYGLERPSNGSREYDLVKKVNKSNGIGMLTKYFKAGSGLAANADQTYCWQHFVDAHLLHQKFAADGWWK